MSDLVKPDKAEQAPERLWLNPGEGVRLQPGTTQLREPWLDYDKSSWSEKRLTDNDVEYVRAATLATKEAECEAMQQRMAEMQERLDLRLDSYARDSELAELRQKLEAAERALRSIAEGNLGDWPGQANYERIRATARRALSGQTEKQGGVDG